MCSPLVFLLLLLFYFFFVNGASSVPFQKLTASVRPFDALGYRVEIKPAINIGALNTPQVAPWSGTLEFPQFNRTGETLAAYVILMGSSGTTQTNATDLLETRVTGHLATQFTMTLSYSPDITVSSTYVIHSPSFNLTNYESQWDSQLLGKSASYSKTFSGASHLPPFIGNGTVSLNALASVFAAPTQYISQIEGVPYTSVEAKYVVPPTMALTGATIKYYY